MRIRAKANGNILDVPDEEAKNLLATGIYEMADVQDAPPEPEPKPKRTYKRRDLEAED